MDHPTPTALETISPPAPREVERKPRRRVARVWLWLLILVLLGAGAWLLLPRFWHPQSSNSSGAGRRGKGGFGPVPVVAARAQKGNVGVYFTGLGTVTPIYTVTVKTRVDGQLMRVLYQEGELVRQGDLLVEIDPRPYQVQLMQAEGQLARDQAALNNARIDLERYKTLWAQNAIPQQQLATQQALVAQDEGAVKVDQGQIESAKLNITYCHIASPITGRVGLRLVDPGNIVRASDANGLLVVTQVDPISVIFTIAEDQLQAVVRRVRAGQRLRVDAWDREMKNRIAQGSLTTIDNQIDQTTGTIRLRSVFDNRNSALFPNQFVNARLLVEQRRGVTVLPGAAIQRNAQSTYVYLVKPDQSVTVRPVTVGATEGDQTEIASGVAPGEMVVTDGVDKLQEGSKVIAHVSGEQPRRRGP